MAWLLDTNIPSELRRLKPEPKVLAFVAAHPLDELYISAVTLAELHFGIEHGRGLPFTDSQNIVSSLFGMIYNQIIK
jgi:predicted nucleic acid-binding protein